MPRAPRNRKTASPKLHEPAERLVGSATLQIHERLVRIEKAIWGDPEAHERYVKTAGDAPRAPKPPDGLFALVDKRLETLTHGLADHDELFEEYGLHGDEVSPDGEAPGDWNHVALKGYVDKGYARLSAALRAELVGYVERTVKELRGAHMDLGVIDARLDALEAGTRELARFMAAAMSKKITKRIVKLLDRWYFDPNGAWILKVIANYLGVPEMPR